MKAVGSAPGKVILTGEHFVVYGEPALVMAINRYVQVEVTTRSDNAIHIVSNLGVSGSFQEEKFRPERGGIGARRILEPIKISAEVTMKNLGKRHGLNIVIASALPVAVGLGSSSASAVSTVATVGRLFGADLSHQAIINLSTEAEKYVHINPSGIDQSVSTYGDVLSYRKSEGITLIKTESVIPIVIGNTGVQRNTGTLVDSVRIRRERFPNLISPLIRIAGDLAIRAIDALKREDVEELGFLMDINHGLLTTIGVSNEVLDGLVYAAKRGGALGAKLTGAGGGGCMIALSRLTERERIAQAISEAGGTPIIVKKASKGVRSWIVK